MRLHALRVDAERSNSQPLHTIWRVHPDALFLLSPSNLGANEATSLRYSIEAANPAACSTFGLDTADLDPAMLERLVPNRFIQATDSEVFRARRLDGSTFLATAVAADIESGQRLLVVRDVSEIVAWRAEGVTAETARIDRIEEREMALDEAREALTQHLFAAGLALQTIEESSSDPAVNARISQVLQTVEGLLGDLVARS